MVQILRRVIVCTLVGLCGCGRGSGDCTAELLIRLSEAEHTLIVGEQFVPRVDLHSCGGRQRLADTLTWRSGDSAVVAVDSAHGIVTGLAPGRATVVVHGARYGDLGEVSVTVVAPLSDVR